MARASKDPIVEHRHTHPITGAPGGWHKASIVHAEASKHEGLIQTRTVAGVVKGKVTPPLKGYVPAVRRGPRVKPPVNVPGQLITTPPAYLLAS